MTQTIDRAFQVAVVIKDPPANAGNERDVSSTPGLGRFSETENGNSFQYLAWKIPSTDEPGGLQFMGSQRVRHD